MIQTANNLPRFDERMLAVLAHLKTAGLETQITFSDKIGCDWANLHKIKRGVFSFKLEHVQKCIDVYGVNPAYFFVQEAPMFTEKPAKKPRKRRSAFI